MHTPSIATKADCPPSAQVRSTAFKHHRDIQPLSLRVCGFDAHATSDSPTRLLQSKPAAMRLRREILSQLATDRLSLVGQDLIHHWPSQVKGKVSGVEGEQERLMTVLYYDLLQLWSRKSNGKHDVESD
jgi:hypothetical protein